MKKILMILVCLMAMTVSVNGHNSHYPTYTIDGITYAFGGSWTMVDGKKTYIWQVQKVHKPNDRTIVIPSRVPIVEEDRTQFSGEELIVANIGEDAFIECVSLDSLIISDGISLDASPYAFRGCRELEYLYYSNRCYDKHTSMIGLSCKTLETTEGCGEKPFWSTIGNTLEKLIIRENTDLNGFHCSFNLCKNLKTIICYKSNPPTVYAGQGNTYSCEDAHFQSDQWGTITLYVPRESLTKYYYHDVWGEIDNIYSIDEMNTIYPNEETDDSASENNTSTDEEVNNTNENENTSTAVTNLSNNVSKNNYWYNLNGENVNNPTKGVYIKNGKKYFVK